jgi:hypothetical protein
MATVGGVHERGELRGAAVNAMRALDDVLVLHHGVVCGHFGVVLD